MCKPSKTYPSRRLSILREREGAKLVHLERERERESKRERERERERE